MEFILNYLSLIRITWMKPILMLNPVAFLYDMSNYNIQLAY